MASLLIRSIRYLVTCDEQFAREVEAGIDILVAQSPRAEITRASLDNEGTIVVAADMAAAVEAVNTVAPEHLELHCKDAMGLLGGIRNAGAIFVGAWSSEPLGDYVAGPNHNCHLNTLIGTDLKRVCDFFKHIKIDDTVLALHCFA